MAIRNISLRALLVNRANDRHGELENETAAIAWLFNERETHMKNLARDIVKEGQIYELPLVSPEGDKFLVFDGNRRVTCLKLLAEPRRAPTSELQEFFTDLRTKWSGKFPKTVQCQVEVNRDRIDEILFRRHTGSQNGIGQSTWDDRMKATFVSRTGKGSGFNVADEVESRLAAAKLLPSRRKIPRSTMNRLLSAEPYRNRLGFSVNRGRFEITHTEDVVLTALARVADDMANRRVVLGHIWDVDGKTAYLDKLEAEGVLPTAADMLDKANDGSPKPKKAKPTAKPKPTQRKTLIPQTDYGLVWPGRLQRHRQIWEELQFHLQISVHPNAISVLFRVLLELSVENYLQQTKLTVNDQDKLSTRVVKIGNDLRAKGKIDQKQLGILTKFQHADKLVSADTLNRYVHSPNFAPSPEHLASMWDTLSAFVVLCLQA
ncbi:hypothetical protein [Shumkonia mesophila]|uniref:hypothetical protein n=1 Tax=Shumkonia mesophila TaxID=2838854 RepID=UPI00293446A7|nr:hypothetical protein [Shumkonia mesophila]